MANIRLVNSGESYISGRVFVGIVLVELGLAWIIGERRPYGLTGIVAFGFMFGSLLLIRSVLRRRRRRPYVVGKLSLIFGLLILGLSFVFYYGLSGYLIAILLVILGLAVIFGSWRR